MNIEEIEIKFTTEKPREIIFSSLLKKFGIRNKLLDIATGTGWSAIIASDEGYNVTAMDGRIVRMPINRTDISWMVSDVMDFNVNGYDTIVMLGLLYHLSLDHQIELLKKCSYTTLIFDTHFANNPQYTLAYRCGDIIDINNYSGRLYKEVDDFSKIKDFSMASLTDEYTFWHTLHSLNTLIENSGWNKLYKVIPMYHPDRTFFVAQK